MISCVGLTRRYGQFVAADSLTFEVSAGTICAMMGHNGAGKSTVLKMLTGLERPSSGRATVAGCDIVTDRYELKRRIGVLPERLGLFDELTVMEHLSLTGDVYGVTDAHDRAMQLMRALDLSHAEHTLAVDCSQGMRKKAALAMALLPNPRVLLLDEPFEALDPVSSGVVAGLLTTAAQRGTTVFVTAHLIDLVQELAQQVILMKRGRIVLDAQSRDLAPGQLESLYREQMDVAQGEDLEWLGCRES